MSDGVLLKQTAWSHYTVDRVQQMTYKSGWKVAKVTPDITANPDLLLTTVPKEGVTHCFTQKGGGSLWKRSGAASKPSERGAWYRTARGKPP